MRLKWLLVAAVTLSIALAALFAVTIGPRIWGPDWHVYGQESRQTTPAQEQAATKCAPSFADVAVLAIFPGQIDVHFRGTTRRANQVAACLKRSPGIVDAAAVRSR